MNGEDRAVFFDFDGTLYITNPSPIDAFIEIAGQLGVAISERLARRLKLWAHHYWSQHEEIRQDMQRLGDDFWIKYSRLLLRAVEAGENLERNARWVRDWFVNEYQPQVTLSPGARETLLHLKSSNYLLGVISNRSKPLQDAVQELGLDGIFEVTLAAGEVGCWKPNPAIFTHALGRCAWLSPQQCWYVGDNYYADGHGAAAAGLRPVLYDPEEIYEEETYPRIRRMDELLQVLQLC